VRDGCVRSEWLSSQGKGSFGGKCGRPVVTNGDFVAYLSVQERRALPRLLSG